MKNILKNNKTLLVIALIAGIVIGKLFTGNSANTDTNNKTVIHNHNENKTEEEKIIWKIK
jgi:uncharacterized protein YxeA